MTRLNWVKNVDITYETGIDKGYIYSSNNEFIAWNGLLSIIEKNSTAGLKENFLDGIKLSNNQLVDRTNLSLSSFTYPDILDSEKSISGFSYRTKISDTRYRIHFIYNPIFEPTDSTYQSINSDLEPIEFSWEVTAKPINISGFFPSAHIFLDVSLVKSPFNTYLYELIYGSDFSKPMWLTPNSWVKIFKELDTVDTMLIIDHGDGMWTAIGPDNMIDYNSSTEFTISSTSAKYISADSYIIGSMNPPEVQ